MLKWREEGTFIEIQCTPGAFTNLSPQLCSMALNYCCCSIAKSCLTLATPWTVARQAPPSMAFPRQEYWSGLPFPSPGDLPHPGIEHASPAWQADSLPSEPTGKPICCIETPDKDFGSSFRAYLGLHLSPSPPKIQCFWEVI